MVTRSLVFLLIFVFLFFAGGCGKGYAEVPGIISEGGRNFYGNVLARDSFNGLRLWNQDLLDPTDNFVMKRLPPDVPSPVAAGDYLFVVSHGKLAALSAA